MDPCLAIDAMQRLPHGTRLVDQGDNQHSCATDRKGPRKGFMDSRQRQRGKHC